mgnify:CR=1 FL=1
MNFLSAIIYMVLAFLLLYRLQYRRAESEDEYFQRFNSLRGLFAIEIVIGHVIRYDRTWLFPLGKFMLVSVAFFFFVSGWGLCRSFYYKKNYLTHFVQAKCGYLLLLSIYAFLLRCIVWIVTGSSEVKENLLVQYFQKTNWYIWELLFFYLLFYLVYKFIPCRLRNILIAVITFICATVLFRIGALQGYYMSALAFPAGLLFHEYFDSVMSFLRGAAGKIAVLAAAGLGLTSAMSGADSLIGMVYLRNLLCLAVLGLMMFFLRYFCPGNIFLKFLGKYSTGIYIYQFTFLTMDKAAQAGWPLRMGLTLGLTLLTSVVMQPVHAWTRNKLGGGKD